MKGWALPNVVAWLLGLALAAGAVFLVAREARLILDARGKAEREAGYRKALSECQEKELEAERRRVEEMREVSARIAALKDEKSRLEAALREAERSIVRRAEKEKDDEKARSERLLADVRDGDLVLRDGVVEAVRECGDGVSEAGSSGRESGCRVVYRLSDEAATALVALARDAEAERTNLSACLAAREQDRKLINEWGEHEKTQERGD